MDYGVESMTNPLLAPRQQVDQIHQQLLSDGLHALASAKTQKQGWIDQRR